MTGLVLGSTLWGANALQGDVVRVQGHCLGFGFLLFPIRLIDRGWSGPPTGHLGRFLQSGGCKAPLLRAEEAGVNAAANGARSAPAAGHAHRTGLGWPGQASVLDVGTGARSQESGLRTVGHI